jgi:hypothetical protein
MKISPAVLGFLRGLGLFLITSVLTYIGTADHLSFLNPVTAGLVASLALALEHAIEQKTGGALFGAAHT